jgi:hypothetical protein
MYYEDVSPGGDPRQDVEKSSPTVSVAGSIQESRDSSLYKVLKTELPANSYDTGEHCFINNDCFLYVIQQAGTFMFCAGLAASMIGHTTTTMVTPLSLAFQVIMRLLMNCMTLIEQIRVFT